jgi:hypothetical protein
MAGVGLFGSLDAAAISGGAAGGPRGGDVDADEIDAFICSITLQVMSDPVFISACGHTFDRSGIQGWFNKGGIDCPKCHAILSSAGARLIPNISLRNAIEEYLAVQRKRQVELQEKQAENERLKSIAVQAERGLATDRLQRPLGMGLGLPQSVCDPPRQHDRARCPPPPGLEYLACEQPDVAGLFGFLEDSEVHKEPILKFASTDALLAAHIASIETITAVLPRDDPLRVAVGSASVGADVGTLAALVLLLKKRMGDQDLVAAVLRAFHRLIGKSDAGRAGADWHPVGALGGGEAVARCITEHLRTPMVVELALETLTCLAQGKGNCGTLSQEKSCECVTLVMRSCKSSPGVQSAGCKAVATLIFADIRNQEKLGRDGAGALVVTAIRTFRRDRDVVYHGVWALCNLAAGCEGSVGDLATDALRQHLTVLGACGDVLQAMRAFPEDREVVVKGCRAIRNLAFQSVENEKALGGRGACELVVGCLRAFPDDWEVLCQGCGAVASLSASSVRNRRALGLAGACKAVVKAMKRYPSDRDVVEYGSHAICNLAAGDDEGEGREVAGAGNCNRRMLGKAGACDVLCAAMRVSKERSIGCQAIRNLSYGAVENMCALGKAGACEAVVAAMRAQPMDRDLAYHGCSAVCSLTPGYSWLLGQGGGVPGGRGGTHHIP